MFEKIGRLAEVAVTSANLSRRGFFSRFAHLAGGAALGAAALLTFSQRAEAGPRIGCFYRCPDGSQCTKPCKDHSSCERATNCGGMTCTLYSFFCGGY
jgi:hypothetical protein